MEEKRILIVDDEPSITTVLSSYFRQRGYLVDVAHDLPSARELIRTNRYSAAISDLRLSAAPEPEGLAVLKDLQTLQSGASVVVLTGYATPELREQVRSLGARAVLDKPVALRDLARSLEQAPGPDPPRGGLISAKG